MKKNCGRLTSCLFLVLMGLGCTGAKKEDTHPQGSKTELAPIKVIINKDNADSKSQSQDADRSCQTDADCMVIPDDGKACFPCSDGAGQEPANMATFKKYLNDHRAQCKPISDKLKASGKAPDHAKGGSCDFNGAKCGEDGQCELANLSTEEMKARMPKMPQGQPQRPQAPEGAGGGQDRFQTSPGLGGQYPVSLGATNAKWGAQYPNTSRDGVAPTWGGQLSTDPRGAANPAWGGQLSADPRGAANPAWGGQFSADPRGASTPGWSGQFPIAPRNGSARFDEGNFSNGSVPANFSQVSNNGQSPFRFGGTAEQYEPRAPQGYARSSMPQAYEDMQSFPGFRGR